MISQTARLLLTGKNTNVQRAFTCAEFCDKPTDRRTDVYGELFCTGIRQILNFSVGAFDVIEHRLVQVGIADIRFND